MQISIDPTTPGAPFPRIHEGRYEVDPVRQQIVDPPTRLIEKVREAGVRLLRCGVGTWYPTQDPPEDELWEYEWFLGTSMSDVDDASMYNFTHLDKTLSCVKALGCDLLLSIEYMPASLADPRPDAKIPERFMAFVGGRYDYPNGVRNAPAREPEVFAAACVRLLHHVADMGVTVRYAELWNEPDLPFWWCGTYEEWFAMYRSFARTVAAAGWKVGGTSHAGTDPATWRDRFLADCARENVPLDFFTWHAYKFEVARIIETAAETRTALDAHGFASTESIPDEWGYNLGHPQVYGSAQGAAFYAACLMGLPAAGVSAQTHAMLVDPTPPGVARLLGMCGKDGDPNPVWFTQQAFEWFQETPLQLPVAGEGWVLAGTNGERVTIIAANPDSESIVLQLSCPATAAQVQLLTQDSFDRLGGWESIGSAQLDSYALELPPYSLAVLRS